MPSWPRSSLLSVAPAADRPAAVAQVPNDVGAGGFADGLLTGRDALLETIHARESVALAGLGAVAGGQSLCDLSRGATPRSTVKYHEGAAAALAEARRAVCSVAEALGSADGDRSLLLGIRASWLAQSHTPGRTGPSWGPYLAGGLDALDQLVNTDRERHVDGTN